MFDKDDSDVFDVGVYALQAGTERHVDVWPGWR